MAATSSAFIRTPRCRYTSLPTKHLERNVPPPYARLTTQSISHRPRQQNCSLPRMLCAASVLISLISSTPVHAAAETLAVSSVASTGLDLYWRYFLAGGICASISHGSTVPIDVVKTRLQTSPESYTGMVDACNKIVETEGVRMLFQGLGPTLLGYSIQGSLKYGFYEVFKPIVLALLLQNFPSASDPKILVWILAGICAELIGSTALCPWEATRIRLVADPSYANGLGDGIAKLLRSEGLLSVFKGLPAILAKQLPYTVTQLATFELLTSQLYGYVGTTPMTGSLKWGITLFSALIAGILSSLASQPGDTLLSRVNQCRTEGSAIKIMQCALNDLGPIGLFRGTKARLVHTGSMVTIQLVIYDLVKQMCGIAATGAH